MLLQGKHPALEIYETLLGFGDIIYYSHFVPLYDRLFYAIFSNI